jgi:leucyl aminopeptidase (aminopeptidase T)
MSSVADHRIRALAELIVRFGANVQPGQIVAVASEPG